MGYVVHHAIVVTGFEEDVQRARFEAVGMGLLVLGPSPDAMNGYSSILICPDGSKEGWGDSDAGDERRDEFVEWLDKQDGFEWCEVAYGWDPGLATVTRSPWGEE